MAIAGSFTSTRLDIGIHYFILGIYPCLLLFYTLFVFKEFKVEFDCFRDLVEKSLTQQHPQNHTKFIRDPETLRST